MVSLRKTGRFGSLSRLADGLQGLALRGAIGTLRRLGPVRASNVGGRLARIVGPHLSVSMVADRNLVQAFPELDATGRKRIIRGVWDNLGRTVAELPHLASFGRTASGPGWEIAGERHVEALRLNGTQALFFSGHFGNWEMVLPIAGALGLTVSGFYRAASNRTVDAIIQSMRQRALVPGVSMFAKGAAGARAALSHLQHGGSLGLLVDQKMNDGIAVPFFGRDAMTAPALAQFALRFGAPIIPVHVVRIGPARFRMICDEPMSVTLSGDRAADTRAIARAMNERLEDWIRADPASWLWLHRRWPKSGSASA
ncbi:MAG: lysophospholipid acyltransferase family protein [Janthinobacterium lividum]